MTKRVSISKKIRFEVFKRDSFKCQYCGKSAPDVILHIDHIHPVSKGGDNNITNLITACFDCNMGKKHRTLNDNTVVSKQKIQLDELNEKRNQLELMMRWRKELLDIELKTSQVAIDEWNSYLKKYHMSEVGCELVRKLIVKYGLSSVLDSMVLASEHLDFDSDNSLTNENYNFSFNKIGAICHFNSKPEWKKQLLYIRGIARNRHSYHDPDVVLNTLEYAYKAGVSIADLQDIAVKSSSWNGMQDMIFNAVDLCKGAIHG